MKHRNAARATVEDTDLSLLLALEALLEERNVTHAAERLGLSQPALSARLNRLRALFADPLFVTAASGRGMVPTPRALALQDGLSGTLDMLRRMLRAPPSFDPASSDRVFVLAMREQPAASLIPALAALLLTEAPAVRLSVVAPDSATGAGLENGAVDLLVAPPGAEAGLMTRMLGQAEFLCAQRSDHPRGDGPLDLDGYCALDHVLVSGEGGFSGVVDRTLSELGRTRRVAISVQNYSIAPLIVAATDCLCTLPARLLKRFPARITLFAPPLALPPSLLACFWHPSRQEDAGHRWLREMLYRAAERADQTV